MNLRTLILIILLLPVTGYCDSGSGWFNGLFKSKAEKEKEVATKIATFNDNYAYSPGLDFSPDGKYLAVPGPLNFENKSEIQIWDWQSGRIVRTLEEAVGANGSLSTEPIRYSPDGRLLVACHGLATGDVVARIWNTETWTVVHDIVDPVPGSGCTSIGFTPDGKSLVRTSDRMSPGDNLTIYDTTSWQLIWGLRTVPFYPQSLTISPDGKFVVIGGLVIPGGQNYSQIAIVDLAQRAIVRTIQSSRYGRMAWSPDGAHITLAGAGEVSVFDVSSGKQVTTEPLKSGPMFVRYTPDGKYLIEADSGGLENGLGVRIWDGQRRELLQEIPGNFGNLAVSRDGHYFAIGNFKSITVWQLK